MSKLDVIERLREANPVPQEPEARPIAPLLQRLEPLDSLLEPPGRARGRLPRRHLKLVLGVPLAGGAAVAIFALTGTPGAGTLDVAAAMYRAITPGSGVLHMTTLTENTAGGHTNTTGEQIWSAQNPRRLRLIISVGGETLESALTTEPVKDLTWSRANPDVITQSTPSNVESTEQTPVSVLREDYQRGEMTLAGKTTTSTGEAAWALDVHPTEPLPSLNGQKLPDPTVLVDATTFVPLELVISGVTAGANPQLQVTKVHYQTYEELPLNAQDEALLTLAAHPGARLESEH